jgi:hypothetical protein
MARDVPGLTRTTRAARSRVRDRTDVGRDGRLKLEGGRLRQPNGPAAVDRHRVQIAVALEDDRLRGSGLPTSGGCGNRNGRDHDDQQPEGGPFVHFGTSSHTVFGLHRRGPAGTDERSRHAYDVARRVHSRCQRAACQVDDGLSENACQRVAEKLAESASCDVGCERNAMRAARLRETRTLDSRHDRLLTVMLVAAADVACSSAGSDDDPEGRIAFAIQLDNAWRLVTANADGSGDLTVLRHQRDWPVIDADRFQMARRWRTTTTKASR